MTYLIAYPCPAVAEAVHHPTSEATTAGRSLGAAPVAGQLVDRFRSCADHGEGPVQHHT